jgi:hypothetical protein
MTSDHDNIVTGGWIKYFELVLNPSPEVVRKIGLVRRLLREGEPLYRAVREARFGWKNYYKYAPLIYCDPGILVPLPKTILKEYRYRGIDVEGIRVVLDSVAKHTVAELIRDVLMGRRGGEEIRRMVKKNPGKHWLQICRELELKWIHELCLPMLLR